MYVNVVGYRHVQGTRKETGQSWEAVDLHYLTDPDPQLGHYGTICNHEFINSKFLPVLQKHNFGVYDLTFGRNYDGKAFVQDLKFVNK